MWKRLMLILFFLALVTAGAMWLWGGVTEPSAPPAYVASTPGATSSPSAPLTEVVAENLTVPWEILFLPEGGFLVTERPGRVVAFPGGQQFTIDGIRDVGEGGLLGAALHPDFVENRLLYLYETTDTAGSVRNRIVRYVFEDDALTLDRVILDDIPGARYHDGGRIVFGPDGYLYVTVGDATRASAAQNLDTREGTILRLTAEGEPAPGNPFDSLVYSYGHRNPQGITWDTSGNLWSSEHGRSGVTSGFDEINLIEPGGNYGWPDSQGDEVASGTIAPARHSTADVTWAPGDLQFSEGSLFMPGLRSETLYEAVLDGTDIVDWKEHFVGEYGRLRSVRIGPDGLFYLLTSNRDGRGDAPRANDDRIIRIHPDRFE